MIPKWGWGILVGVIIVVGGLGVWQALRKPDTVTSQTNIVIDDADLRYAKHEQWIMTVDETCQADVALAIERLTLIPDSLTSQRDSTWAVQNVMAAKLISGDSPTTIDWANVDLSSREAVGLAGSDERRVWIENWEINWENGRVFAQTDSIALKASIVWDELNLPLSSTDENYVRTGNIEGEVVTQASVVSIDCPVRVHYIISSGG
jgi:hypothetical protein